MSYSYAHMCRDGHEQIGHNDSKDDERCPLCRLRDAASMFLDEQTAENAEALRRALEQGGQADAKG